MIGFIAISLLCTLQLLYIRKIKKELNYRKEEQLNISIKTTVIKTLILIAVVLFLSLINVTLSILFTVIFFIVTSFKNKKIIKEINSIDERG